MKLSLLFLLFFAEVVSAQTTARGEISYEGRAFKDDGVKATQDQGSAIFARLEVENEGELFDIVLRGFGRKDFLDDSRDLYVIEDAHAKSYIGEDQDYTFLAGYKLFNWTALEAFHPVDQINSRNLDSNLENLEKMGELTFEFTMAMGEGALSFYFWPLYQKPNLPGARSRLGFGLDLGDTIFEDGDQAGAESGLQFGARISQTFDDMDVSLHVLHHMDRNFPLLGTENFTSIPFVGVVPAETPNKLYYFTVLQVGGTLQYVMGSHLFKVETAARLFQEEKVIYTFNGLRRPVDHQETAVGWEYSLAHESGSESFFYVEANLLTGVNKETRATLSAFQRDLFLAYRYAFNDKDSKEIMVSSIVDLERSHEYFASLSYSQRIGNDWKLKTGVRYYDAPVKGAFSQGLEILHQDNQLYLTGSYFF